MIINSVDLECGTSGKMLIMACENGTAYGIDVANRKQVRYHNYGLYKVLIS